MTLECIYGLVNEDGMLRSITNKRNRKIDIEGVSHIVNEVRTLPHIHHGYYHDEYYGTVPLTY